MSDPRGDLPAIGFQVWGEGTGWDDLMAAARTIEGLGFDSLWANDHFYPAAGGENAAADGDTHEGWITLAGFAAETSRIRLGMLVSAAGYRNIGVVVKMATALDHMSRARMTLGLGAGWHERDHRAFGLDYLSLGERITRLAEQAEVARSLIDGQATTFQGRFVRMERAVNLPPPAQPRLPLLIGGSGEKRTLRIVAQWADAWNGEGDPETYARKNRVLDGHLHDVGRDRGAVTRTAGIPPVCIRASRSEAVRALVDRLRTTGLAEATAEAVAATAVAGPAADVLARLAAWRSAGAAEVIVDWPATPDDETLERLAEARRPAR